MAQADPITIEDPSVVIDSIEFKCAARSAMLDADDDEVSIATFCNPKGTRPGATDWTAEFTLALTYGDSAQPATDDDGTWNQLNAMRKQKKTVVIKPSDGAVTDQNPSATFEAYIPTIPFIDGEVAATDSQEFDLVLSPIGDPVFATS